MKGVGSVTVADGCCGKPPGWLPHSGPLPSLGPDSPISWPLPACRAAAAASRPAAALIYRVIDFPPRGAGQALRSQFRADRFSLLTSEFTCCMLCCTPICGQMAQIRPTFALGSLFVRSGVRQEHSLLLERESYHDYHGNNDCRRPTRPRRSCNLKRLGEHFIAAPSRAGSATVRIKSLSLGKANPLGPLQVFVLF